MSIGETIIYLCMITFVVGLIITAFSYSPGRAAAVKAEETGDPEQIEIVTDRLAVSHRKYVPKRRAELDRHPDYIATHVGVLLVSIGLTFGSIPHATALFGLSPLLQHAFAAAMGVSATFGLIGILISRKNNMLSYALGLSASFGVMLAMGCYEWVILWHSDLIGTAGGGLALTITAARFWMMPRFWRELVSLARLRDRIAGDL